MLFRRGWRTLELEAHLEPMVLWFNERSELGTSSTVTLQQDLFPAVCALHERPR